MLNRSTGGESISWRRRSKFPYSSFFQRICPTIWYWNASIRSIVVIGGPKWAWYCERSRCGGIFPQVQTRWHRPEDRLDTLCPSESDDRDKGRVFHSFAFDCFVSEWRNRPFNWYVLEFFWRFVKCADVPERLQATTGKAIKLPQFEDVEFAFNDDQTATNAATTAALK